MQARSNAAENPLLPPSFVSPLSLAESAPHPPRRIASVFLLLALATLLDYVTGPVVVPTAFYLLAIVVAAWSEGFREGVGVAAVATLLNALADWAHPVEPLSHGFLQANWALNGLVFLAAAGLSALNARQQQLLAAQRDEVARVHSQMEEELRSARMLQELLAGPIPEHPALEIGTYFRPARILGGDATELSLGPDDRLAIMVADVSGKGSPAALAGAILIGMLEEAPGRYRSPAATLRYLNQRLAERLPETMFVTLFYALLDLRAGGLTYASAGHDPPLVLRATASGEFRLEELAPTGMLLGYLPKADFEEVTVPFGPGDLLFCYTDGITDLRDRSGKRLGHERLEALVADRAALLAPELISEVLREATYEASDLPDDISLVAVRYLGSTQLFELSANSYSSSNSRA